MAHEIFVNSRVSEHFIDIFQSYIITVPQFKTHGVVMVNLPKKEVPQRGIQNVYVSPDVANKLCQKVEKLPNTDKIFCVKAEVTEKVISPNDFLKSIPEGNKQALIGGK